MRSPLVRWFREGATFTAILIALIVAMPLLAVAALLLRSLLLVAFLGTLGLTVVVYAVSPAFRGWARSRLAPMEDVAGLRLATDVALDDGHAWVRFEGGDAVLGVDDLVAAVLGPIGRVILPERERFVERGQELCRVERDGRSLAIASPVTGTVAATNPALLANPGLLNAEPFGAGWVARVRPVRAREERARWHRGSEARVWLRREVDRLVGTLLRDQPHAEPIAADGGTLVNDLYRHIDQASWKRLRQSFFPAVPTSS